MMRESHVALGSAVVFFFMFPRCLFCLAVAVWYSILPDYDVRYKHRKSLHNVFAMLILSLPWIVFSPDLFLAASLSYFTHLLADMMTVRGVALFYPFSSKYYRIAKFRSSSLKLNLGTIALSAILIYLKLSWLLGPR